MIEGRRRASASRASCPGCPGIRRSVYAEPDCPFRRHPGVRSSVQMEAATPLRQAHVRTSATGSRSTDSSWRTSARYGSSASVSSTGTIRAGRRDAIEIGARVLDREQAGANAEYVKAEFEKASRDLQHEFTEQARTIDKSFEDQFAAVFGEDDGQLAKELERRFGDGSATSVQNRLRETVGEVLAKSREDLMKQFSSADGSNPLADFKAGAIRVLKAAEERQHETQQRCCARWASSRSSFRRCGSRRRSSRRSRRARARHAKGRTFEEAVADAVDRIALAQGDVAEAVGDLKEATGKVGDVVVAIDACNGPARGRIVFEAKDRKSLSAPTAFKELDSALTERSADFAVMVVPSDDRLPASSSHYGSTTATSWSSPSTRTVARWRSRWPTGSPEHAW